MNLKVKLYPAGLSSNMLAPTAPQESMPRAYKWVYGLAPSIPQHNGVLNNKPLSSQALARTSLIELCSRHPPSTSILVHLSCLGLQDVRYCRFDLEGLYFVAEKVSFRFEINITPPCYKPRGSLNMVFVLQVQRAFGLRNRP